MQKDQLKKISDHRKDVMIAIGSYWITRLRPGSLITHSGDIAVVVFSAQTYAIILKYWRVKRLVSYFELSGVGWEIHKCELLIDDVGEFIGNE